MNYQMHQAVLMSAPLFFQMAFIAGNIIRFAGQFAESTHGHYPLLSCALVPFVRLHTESDGENMAQTLLLA